MINQAQTAEQVPAADNHPVWMQDQDWTAGESIHTGQFMQLADGDEAGLLGDNKVHRTQLSHVFVVDSATGVFTQVFQW